MIIGSEGFSAEEDTIARFIVYGTMMQTAQDPIPTYKRGEISLILPTLDVKSPWTMIQCNLYTDNVLTPRLVDFSLSEIDEEDGLSIYVGKFEFNSFVRSPKLFFKFRCSTVAPTAIVFGSYPIEVNFDGILMAKSTMMVQLEVTQLAGQFAVSTTFVPHRKEDFELTAFSQGYLVANITSMKTNAEGIIFQFDENSLVVSTDKTCSITINSISVLASAPIVSYRTVALDNINVAQGQDVHIACPGVIISRPSNTTDVSCNLVSRVQGQNLAIIEFNQNSTTNISVLAVMMMISIAILGYMV